MAETATIKPQYEKADELFEDNKFQETFDLLKTFEVIGRFYFVESHSAIILFFRINPIRKICGGVGGLCTRSQRIAAPKTLKRSDRDLNCCRKPLKRMTKISRSISGMRFCLTPRVIWMGLKRDVFSCRMSRNTCRSLNWKLKKLEFSTKFPPF